MWRRIYLLLTLVRLFFALSSSYLHPDEHFQGPEVIAGRVYGYPVHQTWEFSTPSPIRSAFALWPTYGLPMLIIRWLWEGSDNGNVKPIVAYWTLRVLMLALSLVLEDWAVYELVEAPHRRQEALLLVASSYVTWTWQNHTFSNSIETLTVLWSLVIIKRMMDRKGSTSSLFSPMVLGILLVFGTFNRITFPTYLMAPCLQLLPSIIHQRTVLCILALSGLITTLLAVLIDTTFYAKDTITFSTLFQHPIITPLNSLLYNSQPSNLHSHGQHPLHQHVLINLPQLLGPAFILLFTSVPRTTAILSALSSTLILSVFPHQEARFLLAVVPLVLLSVQIPTRYREIWLTAWLIFNAILGLLMGIYHQGGVVSAQSFIETLPDASHVYWWKTYSPPTWLLGSRNSVVQTMDLMGLPATNLQSHICESGAENEPSWNPVLVAPYSATFLDRYANHGSIPTGDMRLTELWSFRSHINLDDMDFGDDGIKATIQRVLGRRGLKIWKIRCKSNSAVDV